jgi:hypothetical protein
MPDESRTRCVAFIRCQLVIDHNFACAGKVMNRPAYKVQLQRRAEGLVDHGHGPALSTNADEYPPGFSVKNAKVKPIAREISFMASEVVAWGCH